jgi:hypothetical protein
LKEAAVKGHLDKTIFILAAAISLNACTSRNNGPVVVPTGQANQEDDSSTFDTSSTMPSESLFDSSGSTSSNLFDTTTATDIPASTTTTTTSTEASLPVTETQQQCLASGSLLGSSTGGGLNDACYSSNSPYLDQDSLFGLAADSYGNMDYCFKAIMQHGTQYCKTGGTLLGSNELNVLFRSSQMGLVRCFRKILRNHMMSAQWVPEQKKSYENNDSLLFFFLTLLSGNNG